jgi:hypothetical protein
MRSLSNCTLHMAINASIAILLVIESLSYRSIVISNESDQWIQHTRVLDDVQRLTTGMAEISSSIRGFVIIGDEFGLEPYHAASADGYLTRPVEFEGFECLLKSTSDFWLTRVMLPPQTRTS